MKTQTELKQEIDSVIRKSISLDKEFDIEFMDILGKQSIEIIQWGAMGQFQRISLTGKNLKDILRESLKFKKMVKNDKQN